MEKNEIGDYEAVRDYTNFDLFRTTSTYVAYFKL